MSKNIRFLWSNPKNLRQKHPKKNSWVLVGIFTLITLISSAVAYNYGWYMRKEPAKEDVSSQNSTQESEPKSEIKRDFTETVNGVSFNMIFVEGGKFMMGSEEGVYNEEPIHEVTLTDFLLAETEVTQELWWAVMGDSEKLAFKDCDRCHDCDKCPVGTISWEYAQKFIEKLNKLTGKNYSLPTEAQWEYGARGGKNWKDGFTYSGSNNIDEVAWYYKNSDEKTHPIKRKKPNQLGLYDMSGNVWEWCRDYYDANFYIVKNNVKNSINPENKLPNENNYKVLRGGSWSNYGYLPVDCRVSVRYRLRADNRYNSLGLRLSLQK